MKFLVVEDKAENRQAAEEFFTSQNIEVEFAVDAEEAEKELDNNECYHGAIIDLALPVPGGIVEQVGYSLAQKAKNYGLPAVVLTAGMYHHGSTSVILDEDAIELERGPGKDTPQAYEIAFGTLLKLCPSGKETLEEVFVSRKRYKERTGRQHQMRP